jgi:hypothetical protein
VKNGLFQLPEIKYSSSSSNAALWLAVFFVGLRYENWNVSGRVTHLLQKNQNQNPKNWFPNRRRKKGVPFFFFVF